MWLYSCTLSRARIHIPVVMYFHENQFSYPGQQHDPGIFQFASINFTSALCADRLAFNSRYNLETFLTGIRFYLKSQQIWSYAILKSRFGQSPLYCILVLIFSRLMPSWEDKMGEGERKNPSLSGIIVGNMIKIQIPFSYAVCAGSGHFFSGYCTWAAFPSPAGDFCASQDGSW